MVKVLLSGEGPIISGSDEALITRYVSIGKRPTTFRLEAFTWNLFCAIARRQNLTVNELCSDLAEVTAADSDLAATIRCYVLGDSLCQNVPLDLLSPQIRDMIEKPPTIQ
jgi:predicted DNA-binding ribbon-helix-helix protein